MKRLMFVFVAALVFATTAFAQEVQPQKVRSEPVAVMHYFGVTSDVAIRQRIADAVPDPQLGALFNISGHRYFYHPGDTTSTLELYVRKAYKGQQFQVKLFCLWTDVLFGQYPPEEQTVEGAVMTRDKQMHGLEYVISIPRGLYFPGATKVVVIDNRTGFWQTFTINRNEP